MKKLFSLLCVVCLALSLSACTGITDPKVSKIVNSAEKELTKKWQQIYDESSVETDRYFEIKNTRVLFIKDDTDVEEFQDIAYIVEFDIYSDYFGTAPYYTNVSRYDSVTVLKDGSMVVNAQKPMHLYSSTKYTWDYSNIIESITDCGDQYNTTKTLK